MKAGHLHELPKTWIWTRLRHIGIIASGGTPSTKDVANFGGEVPWITPSDLSGYRGKFISRGKRNITEKGLKSSSATLLPPGTILFSSRAPIGYVAIASNAIATNQGFKNLIPSDLIFVEYIYHYLKGSKHLAESYASGTTFLEISGSRFAELPIPLAPLQEQRRIVRRIEELFTKLDAGVTSLKTGEAQLSQYRLSVLSAAMRGELTEKWRDEHSVGIEPVSVLLEECLRERREVWETEQLARMRVKGKPPRDDVWKRKYKEPRGPAERGLHDLPSQWMWVSVEQVSQFVTDGDHNPPKRVESGIPHFTARNVIDWKLIEKGCTYIRRKDFERLRRRYDPEEGDVIITVVGTVGRTAIVPRGCIFSADRNLAAVRLIRGAMDPRFLQFNLNTPAAQQAMGGASGSTAQPHLYLNDIRRFPVALAPLAEQEATVEETERRLGVAQEAETVIKENLRRAEKLRQSILKRAFTGKLVPQDNGDEPASILLEEMRTLKGHASRNSPEKRSQTEIDAFQMS